MTPLLKREAHQKLRLDYPFIPTLQFTGGWDFLLQSICLFYLVNVLMLFYSAEHHRIKATNALISHPSSLFLCESRLATVLFVNSQCGGREAGRGCGRVKCVGRSNIASLCHRLKVGLFLHGGKTGQGQWELGCSGVFNAFG